MLVNVHYTLSLCHGHSWRVRLAKQEMLTPPGHLSPLVSSVNFHRGGLLLVPQWQCISCFVFYIDVGNTDDLAFDVDKRAFLTIYAVTITEHQGGSNVTTRRVLWGFCNSIFSLHVLVWYQRYKEKQFVRQNFKIKTKCNVIVA